MEQTILDLADAAAVRLLAATLVDEHVADAAEFLNDQPLATAAALLAQFPPERAAETLDQPGFDAAGALIDAMPESQARAVLAAMSADRRADIARHLDRPARARLIARLDPEARTALERLLAYPEDTAASLMTTEFVSVPKDWSVEQVLQHIRAVGGSRETIYAIYIVDPRSQKLLRSISLRRLIASDAGATVLAAAVPRKPIRVAPLTDREDVARVISKYDLLAVPVVDNAGRILGIVTVDDIIDAIMEETTEDVQKFGGMEALDEPYRDISFARMIRKRAGWLCALFVSEMLTASAMQHFDDELQKAIVLTLFIPLIMSSGGNSGSQATSLVIRAIALGQLRLRDWWRVALRELPTGLTLGLILGLIGMVRIAVWQATGLYDYGPHWRLIALTVGAALLGIVTFGSLAGSMLPFILKRIGFDPASASAPFVATLVDVTGLVIYFSVALIFLSGTLL